MVFGDEKGKNGNIGKTDEELIHDLISIHNAENWLGADSDDFGAGFFSAAAPPTAAAAAATDAADAEAPAVATDAGDVQFLFQVVQPAIYFYFDRFSFCNSTILSLFI